MWMRKTTRLELKQSIYTRDYETLIFCHIYTTCRIAKLLLSTYLARENETQQDGYRQLTVAKEDYIEQIRVGWMLKEEPEKKVFYEMLPVKGCVTLLYLH